MTTSSAGWDGVTHGSVSVPGTLTGNAVVLCNAGGTEGTGYVQLGSVNVTAVRVGESVGSVSFPCTTPDCQPLD